MFTYTVNIFIVLFINLINIFFNHLHIPSARSGLPVNDSNIVPVASGSKGKSSNDLQKSAPGKLSHWKPVKKSMKKKGGHLDKRKKK